jgi:hypothetical protein
VGCRSPDEVDEDASLAEVDIPAELWDDLQ